MHIKTRDKIYSVSIFLYCCILKMLSKNSSFKISGFYVKNIERYEVTNIEVMLECLIMKFNY